MVGLAVLIALLLGGYLAFRMASSPRTARTAGPDAQAAPQPIANRCSLLACSAALWPAGVTAFAIDLDACSSSGASITVSRPAAAEPKPMVASAYAPGCRSASFSLGFKLLLIAMQTSPLALMNARLQMACGPGQG